MSFTNVKEFTVSLDKFKVTVEKTGVLFVKKVAFLVLGGSVQLEDGRVVAGSGVLLTTPVLTGRAVGNWQVTIGSPASGVIDTAPGSRAAAKKQVEDQAKSALSGLRFGQDVWVVNNLDYIAVLNDGTDSRPAHHMLERAVDNARQSIRRAA